MKICDNCLWFFNNKCQKNEEVGTCKSFTQKGTMRLTIINGRLAEVMFFEDISLCRIGDSVYELPTKFLNAIWREDENIDSY